VRNDFTGFLFDDEERANRAKALIQQPPTMTQKMTSDAFSLLVGVFSASAVNQSSDCPESANGIGGRMTQRPGIYLDFIES